MSTNKKTVYKDLDLDFKPHPVSGDLLTKTNIAAVKQSIQNLIQTQFYDVPFHPEIGCQARGLLFNYVSDASVGAIRQVIHDVLSNNEPRIRIIDIIVSIDSSETQYQADVVYTMTNSNEPQRTTTILKRIR